jgi:hypothetical protein
MLLWVKGERIALHEYMIMKYWQENVYIISGQMRYVQQQRSAPLKIHNEKMNCYLITRSPK